MPMDWVKFLGSATVGLVSYLISMDLRTALTPYLFYLDAYTMFLQVAVVGSLDMPKADLWVMFAILSTVIGYCAKTYFT